MRKFYILAFSISLLFSACKKQDLFTATSTRSITPTVKPDQNMVSLTLNGSRIPVDSFYFKRTQSTIEISAVNEFKRLTLSVTKYIQSSIWNYQFTYEVLYDQREDRGHEWQPVILNNSMYSAAFYDFSPITDKKVHGNYDVHYNIDSDSLNLKANFTVWFP